MGTQAAEEASVSRGSAIIWLTGIIAALTSGALIASVGPEAEVVCGTGHVLDRLVQAIMRPLGAGHVDGAAASSCVVPSSAAWAMSAGALVLVLASTLLLARRLRARLPSAGPLQARP